MAYPVSSEETLSPASQFHFQSDRLISVEQLALILLINPDTIYKTLNGTRSIPLPRVCKLGRFWRFRLSDVAHFMNELSGNEPTVAASVAVCVHKKRGRPANTPRQGDTA